MYLLPTKSIIWIFKEEEKEMLVLVLIDTDGEKNFFECDTAAEAVKVATCYIAKGWKISNHFFTE